MKKIAVILVALMSMVVFSNVFACDSVHKDQATSTGSPTTSGTPVPAK